MQTANDIQHDSERSQGTAYPSEWLGPLWRFDRIRIRRLIGLTILFAILVGVVEGIMESVPGIRFREALWYCGLYGYMLAWCFGSCRRIGISRSRFIGPAPTVVEWKLALLAIPLIGVSLGAFWALYLPLSYAFPEFILQLLWLFDDKVWALDAPGTSIVNILIMVVLAPVVEESLYRGVLIHRWSHRWGSRAGILGSAAFFAIGHMDVIGAFLFALVMTGLYIRTKKLIVPILCHMANNAIAAVFEFFPIESQYVMISEFQRQWWIGAIGLAAGGTLLYALRANWIPDKPWTLPLAEPGPNAESVIAVSGIEIVRP